jgi:hypothetical protein
LLKHGGQHRHNLDGPPMHRGVVNGHATLRHHLFQVPHAQRVGHISANAGQHHAQRVVHSLNHLAQCRDHRLSLSSQPVRSIPSASLLRQNPRHASRSTEP